VNEIRKSLISPIIFGVALILQILWRSVPHSYADLFNFLSVAVILLALRHGEGAGAIGGSVAGLIQDSLTLHLFGLAGLTKTCLGFAVGLAYRKLNLTPFINQLLFIFAAGSLELLLWAGLANLIFTFHPPIESGSFWFQPIGTTLLSGFLFRWIKS